MGAMRGGPTPWWQLPEYSKSVPNLEQSAPPGYTYDKVRMEYVKTPTQAGTEQNQFNTAANPALAGLMSQLTGNLSGTGSSGGFNLGGSGATAGTGIAGGGTTVPTSGTIGSRPTIPGITLPDQTAATDARFATAKDRVGKIGRASLDALRGELGASGMLGGGAEAQAVRDVVQSGAGELGQVSRDEAMKQADLAADFAKTSYGGSITQRGQDVAAREAEARLAQEKELANSRMSFEQQQLKSQQQLQMLQLALGGLKSMGTSGYSY